METIGDAYMVICGAPEITPNHAEYITNFAFSIIEATSKINDPSTSKSLEIRVGECVCVCMRVCACIFIWYAALPLFHYKFGYLSIVIID